MTDIVFESSDTSAQTGNGIILRQSITQISGTANGGFIPNTPPVLSSNVLLGGTPLLTSAIIFSSCLILLIGVLMKRQR